MPMPKLTKEAVTRAQARKSKYELCCAELHGFILRVLPSGKKVYYVRFRDDAGKDVRRRLGPTTELSYRDARNLAAQEINARKPALAPQHARRSGSKCPTIAQFAKRFVEEHVNVRLKPHSQRKYPSMLRNRILPAFGRCRLDEVTYAQVCRWHGSHKKTPSEANGCLVTLSSLYSRAIEWGVLPRGFDNPAHGVKKFPIPRRERFLSPKERRTLERFLDHALTIPHNKPGYLKWHTVAAIRLLAYTGMRRGEVLSLTWAMVDERHQCFRLPDSKTGQKVVPVSTDVIALVRECRKVWKACKHRPRPTHVVFARGGGPLTASTLGSTWINRVRNRIPGFEDVRLHDLRHSAASDALMAGVPLAVVGRILGHKQPTTTARYAHLSDSVVEQGVKTMAEAIRTGAKTGRRKKSRS